MSKLLSLSIDLSKVDKSKIVEGKNGALYYSLTIDIKDEKDQYGNDVSSWTTQTKEERENKVNRTFLGNGRVIYSNIKDSNNNTEVKTQEYSDLPF
jgi:hypothetical protein